MVNWVKDLTFSLQQSGFNPQESSRHSQKTRKKKKKPIQLQGGKKQANMGGIEKMLVTGDGYLEAHYVSVTPVHV